MEDKEGFLPFGIGIRKCPGEILFAILFVFNFIRISFRPVSIERVSSAMGK